MRGLFISFEGGDGSGKSTQINLIKNYFENLGHDVVLTREPGGTRISEEIRKIILNKDYLEMDDATEALLYAASRAQHVKEFILPNLNKGKIVICDRFVDSSLVYQGYARGIGVDKIEEINSFATLGLTPDLTILLQLEAKQGLARKKNQKDLDRIELEEVDFHQKVIEGYKFLLERDSDRLLPIDATMGIEKINKIIINKVKSLLDE